MKNLQRFTTQFRGIEDRFLFIGEDADGETVSLWLTQRLLLKTIPVLLDWLQKNDPVDLKAADNRARASEMAQVFASDPVQPKRQAAEPGKVAAGSEKSEQPDKPEKPQQAVKPDAEARLVHTINLSLNPKRVQLRFQQQDEELASLSLKGASLRQWLVVLHVLWNKSDWPAGIWPDWLRENSKIAATQTERAYH